MNTLPEVKLVRADQKPLAGDTKFGGSPTIICGEVENECCGKPMALFGQLDTNDFPEADLHPRLIAYVFICLDCYCFSLATAAADHP